MANEIVLKMIVNGLERLAADNQILCEILNRRALVHEFDETFEGVPFSPPECPYQDVAASQTRAAELFAAIADHVAIFVAHLGGEPAEASPLQGAVDEADLLRLVVDWGTVQSGVQRAIVQLYGGEPAPPAGLPIPGPASEALLWSEIVAWAEKMLADSARLIQVQQLASDFEPEPVAPSGPVVVLEQEVQRATLNTLRLAALLPYHLFHAAHATPQGSQSARSRQPATRKAPTPRRR